MTRVQIVWHDYFDGLLRRIDRGTHKTLNRAAYAIRKDAVSSIKSPAGTRRRDPVTGRFMKNVRIPSPPGTPVHTHRTNRGVHLFRRAIRYDVNRQQGWAVIGPRYSVVKDVGYYHEFGKRRRRQRYPARPTMGPALRKNIPQLPRYMRGFLT